MTHCKFLTEMRMRKINSCVFRQVSLNIILHLLKKLVKFLINMIVFLVYSIEHNFLQDLARNGYKHKLSAELSDSKCQLGTVFSFSAQMLFRLGAFSDFRDFLGLIT
jgi:hypothetical protein